jgi:DNA-binding transcriptional LysR family regulator
MHPRLLKTFLAVARSRNITRAAQEIHLAQSSVSDQIQSLETELGADLFTRSKLGLELTRAGETLKPYAEEILMLADEARAAVEAITGQTAGTLTIGALETIASVKLPQWLSTFQGDHPDIHLRLKVAGSGDLLRKLEDGEIDVAFCFDKGGLDDRLGKRTMSAEPLILVASPEKESTSMRGDLTAFASMSFVATEVGCVYRHLFDEAFAEAGIAAPKLAAEVGSIGMITRLVAAKAGMGLVPRFAVADALDRGEIIEMPWLGSLRTASLVMIWRRRRVQPPALKLLLAAASDNYAPVKSADAPPFDMQYGPGREGVAHKEADRVGDIVWLSDASNWQSLRHRVQRLVFPVAGNEGPDGRVDPAWRDRVDPDGRQFDRKCPDKSFQRRVDSSDDRPARRWPIGGDAGCEGD